MSRKTLHGFVARLTAMTPADDAHEVWETGAEPLSRGRGEADVWAVLGGSFLRVAEEVRG